MSEDIQELFQVVFVWLWAIFLLFVVGISILTINQYANFQETANQVISRYGGVTSKVETTLKKVSHTYYNDKFTVKSRDHSTKYYGDVVNYDIEVKLPVLSNVTTINIGNSTVSDVRKGTGDK